MEARETRVAVPGGTVWVRASGGGPGTPLLLLHGGPGVPGRYLEGLEALGDERTVVRYDQLGCGRFDEATPEALEAFRARVPGAEIAILEDSAHRTMLDEPEAYEAILRGFLRRVDARRGAAQWESAGASR